MPNERKPLSGSNIDSLLDALATPAPAAKEAPVPTDQSTPPRGNGATPAAPGGSTLDSLLSTFGGGADADSTFGGGEDAAGTFGASAAAEQPTAVAGVADDDDPFAALAAPQETRDLEDPAVVERARSQLVEREAAGSDALIDLGASESGKAPAGPLRAPRASTIGALAGATTGRDQDRAARRAEGVAIERLRSDTRRDDARALLDAGEDPFAALFEQEPTAQEAASETATAATTAAPVDTAPVAPAVVAATPAAPTPTTASATGEPMATVATVPAAPLVPSTATPLEQPELSVPTAAPTAAPASPTVSATPLWSRSGRREAPRSFVDDRQLPVSNQPAVPLPTPPRAPERELRGSAGESASEREVEAEARPMGTIDSLLRGDAPAYRAATSAVSQQEPESPDAPPTRQQAPADGVRVVIRSVTDQRFAAVNTVRGRGKWSRRRERLRDLWEGPLGWRGREREERVVTRAVILRTLLGVLALFLTINVTTFASGSSWLPDRPLTVSSELADSSWRHGVVQLASSDRQVTLASGQLTTSRTVREIREGYGRFARGLRAVFEDGADPRSALTGLATERLRTALSAQMSSLASRGITRVLLDSLAYDPARFAVAELVKPSGTAGGRLVYSATGFEISYQGSGAPQVVSVLGLEILMLQANDGRWIADLLSFGQPAESGPSLDPSLLPLEGDS